MEVGGRIFARHPTKNTNFFLFCFFLSSSESLVSSFKIVSSSFVSFCHWIYPKMGREKGTNNIPLLTLDSPPKRTRNYTQHFQNKIFNNKSNGGKKIKSNWNVCWGWWWNTHTHTHELKKKFPFCLLFNSFLFAVRELSLGSIVFVLCHWKTTTNFFVYVSVVWCVCV